MVRPRYISTIEGKTLKVVGMFYDASAFSGVLIVNTDVEFEGRTCHATIRGTNIVLKPVLK